MNYRTFFFSNSTTPRGSGLRQPLFCVLFILLLAFGLNAIKAQAQTYVEKPLYSFDTNPGDGFLPVGKLVSVNNIFYGVTGGGGTSHYGTIFSINADGTGYQTLHSFQGNPDGANPASSLIAVNGILYGTTQNGGNPGYGTIFSINPDGTGYQTLYSFQGGTTDGDQPVSELLNVNGILYGTTFGGGTSSYGTIYSIKPDGTDYQLLYSFQATSTSDGANPEASLLNVSGIFYGATSGGGSLGYGSVFAFDPTTNTDHIVHSFTGVKTNSDGEDAASSLIAVNGFLFGTTSLGGMDDLGTVFGINTAGTIYENLHSFTGAAGDGARTRSDLLDVNGVLYGTTSGGGSMNQGTIFSMDISTFTQTTIYQFQGGTGDGIAPSGGLINVNGILYGMTESGGLNHAGTLYCLIPVTVPVAKNDVGRGIANHPITVSAPGVLGNDNNGGDPNCYMTLTSNTSHGSLWYKSNGGFSYTPNTGFVGTDSFTYKDTNAAGTSNTATCTLTIGPIAYDDQGRTYFNTPVTINAPGVLANDVTGGIATTASLVTNPAHGTVTFNSNGSFTYTPTTGFLGTDSFTYKITSAGGTSAPATCTITVQARTPVANNDSGRVTHNTTLTITAPGVLGNDNPGTTGTVTAAIVTNPSHGTITFNSNGSFVYKPTTGFIGTDSFTYKDTNAIGTSNTATCTLTVQ